jgi:hypothetical protein
MKIEAKKIKQAIIQKRTLLFLRGKKCLGIFSKRLGFSLYWVAQRITSFPSNVYSLPMMFERNLKSEFIF